MRQAERSDRHVLDQTWNRMLDVSPSPSRAGPVSTLRVKIIGTATDTDTQPKPPSFGKTKRYPSLTSLSADDEVLRAGRDWRVLSARDVTLSFDADELPEEPLALASTLPALTHEDLGIEESGVHTVDRLRLALDPRDGAASPGPLTYIESQTSTLRLRAQRRAPLARAWRSWERQSPIIAFGTAAMFCFLSALLVSMLAP